MSNYISLEDVIKNLSIKNIKFGKGDPYNRLRYYTKVGWLPNMKRIKDKKGNVTGHYPRWVINRIIRIEQMKESGISNSVITEKLSTQNKYIDLISNLYQPEHLNKLQKIGVLTLLLIIIILQLRVIGNKESPIANANRMEVQSIKATGVGVIAKGQTGTVITTPFVTSTSKVTITPKSKEMAQTGYWVTDIINNVGFTVKTNTIQSNDLEFYWLLAE